MIVTAIHWHRTTGLAPESFRFAGGRGNLRRTWITSSEQKTQQEWFVKALACALTDQPMAGLMKVTVELSDDAGSSYKITRNTDRVNCEKDGRSIARETLLAELRDGLDVINSSHTEFHELFQSFRVSYENDAYLARREHRDTLATKDVREVTLEIRRLSQKLNQSLGTKWTPSNIAILDRRLNDLSPRIWEVRSQIAKVESMEENKFQDRSQEVGLLKEMQSLLNELEGSGLPVSEIHARRKNLEDQISDMRVDSEWVATAQRDINWKSGFTLLGRIQVARRVVKILTDKKMELSNHLQGSFEPLNDQWTQFKELDYELIKSLQKSLTLMLTGTSVSLRIEDRKKSLTWFDRFKVQDAIKPPELAFELPEAGLSELAEQTQSLMKCLDSIRDRHDDRLKKILAFSETLDTLYEAYVLRLDQLKGEWQVYAKGAGIPESLTLESFPKAMETFYSLKTLSFEVESLERVMSVKKKAASRLVEVIHEWRKLTQSQKQTVPHNVPMMIAEAQGYMRYLAKFEKEDLETQDRKTQNLNNEILLSRLKERLRELDLDWNESFTKLGLDVVKVEDVSAHLDLTSVIHYLTKKYDQMQKEAALSPLGFYGAFFNVWHLEDSEQETNTLSELTKNPSPHVCHLIVVNSEQRALELYALGAGRILEIPPVDQISPSQAERSPTLKPMVERATIGKPSPNSNSKKEPLGTANQGKMPPTEQLLKTLEMLQGKRR